jgi:tRNA isopentenyl-2-thiomethyl-A-37 hydroxylase MiaE
VAILRQIQGFADILIRKLMIAGVDSAVIDSVDRLEARVLGGSRHFWQVLEAVQERMVALPNMPISTLDKGLEIIQRKDCF